MLCVECPYLICIGSGHITRALLDRLLDPNMEELDLLNCEFSDQDYRFIVSACTNLRALTLGASTDAMIKTMVTMNPNLEHLSLFCTKQLTRKAVKLIADNCSRLQVLHLKYSERIADKV